MPSRPISVKTAVDWTRGLSSEIPNTGSAARDHLAAERTVLAWLRTSMVLATVGIALAQLLRLPSTAFSTDSRPPMLTIRSASIDMDTVPPSATLDSLASLAATADPDLRPLVRLLAHQQSRLEALAQAQSPMYPMLAVVDESRYAHLAKPLGGTFLALGFVFVLLGIHRYYTVQRALMREPSQFPPSRRSVGIGAVCIGALVVACFASVLANRSS